MLALIALQGPRTGFCERNRGIVAANTPAFNAFFAEFADAVRVAATARGLRRLSHATSAVDGVEAMCTELVEQDRRAAAAREHLPI